MPDSSSELHPEVAAFLADHPDTVAIDLLLADLSGVIRGKRYPVEDLKSVWKSGVTFPASVFLLDTNGQSHDPGGKGFSDGDPDAIARPIPGSLKPVPWAKRPLGQLLLTFSDSKNQPLAFEPRNVLARALGRLRELGLRPVVAFELEFYLLDKERAEGRRPQPPLSPLTGKRESGTQVYGMDQVDGFEDLLEDITDACDAQGIPTGAISAEYAPGQFEINLRHETYPLMAADHCVLFKRVVRGVARKHGYQATFMAKPYPEEAGSGLHLHVSLYDEEGNNVFDGGEALASDTLRHAIGGVLDLLPESMAFLAPNVNSYRRFEPNIFVPITRSWGFENRSVAMRVPIGSGKARRIESRVAGADANPYLALASMIAGIHHGIVNRIDPGAPHDGNAGESFDKALPMRPRRALEQLLASEIIPQYLGADYPKLYAACKEAEYDEFDWLISPQEYDWYLQAD
ncbi:glutamine synthetase family protein [Aquibaculum arenosum]|uniref:Glutamine synthetase family protein n=1 Tax=Aquibaculum arenosum TaxID=3032591 RepID=A0ABT5YJW3_9PROT|nr:glutamine synthetase family protein [Fodinicurvata sp. CAU 1616]MDF2094554.1 glutamine synthetase family protein [Fodinicurvata sp. CAU 1616]